MALELVSEILLPRLLAASVQSSLLVILVWALCRALPRLSASARAGLWWLVALQLVVGVLWSSPLALPLLPAEVVQQVQAAPVHASALQESVLSPVPAASASTTTVLALSSAPAASSWSWSSTLALLWLLGLACMIARTLRGYLATRRLLAGSRPCKDALLLGALRLAAEAHGLRAPPRLRLSASIDSPQLIGPWNPVLLLPATPAHAMHADELDMALTHELVHLQRRDLWWGLLPAAAQHLFFFHPLAHLAAHEYALAREAACDAAVIAGNRHCAHDYGRLLVRLGVAPKPSAGLASASPTFRILKRRLVMLQNTASTPRVVALLLTVAVAALGVMPYRIVAAPAPTKAIAAAAPTPPVHKTAPKGTVATAAMTAPVAVVSAGSSAFEMAAPPPPPPPPRPAVPPAPLPAPPAPPAAPAPRALPVPPVPPAPLTTRGIFTLGDGMQRAYVFFQDDHSIAAGSRADLREANKLRHGNESLLWFRKGAAKYVVRDPATLQRFRASYAEVVRLGDQQGALGNRQGALGNRQGALGERQGALGMKQAELAMGGLPESERDARMAEVDRKMAALARQMAEFNAPMADLGRQMAALSKQMQAADARAGQQARKLIDEAIASGLAKPAQG
ncbi:MAG: M56 family metallopeptidase [Pseudoxanthomonas sp.]